MDTDARPKDFASDFIDGFRLTDCLVLHSVIISLKFFFFSQSLPKKMCVELSLHEEHEKSTKCAIGERKCGKLSWKFLQACANESESLYTLIRFRVAVLFLL